jgi:hypothetical protein
MPPIAALRRIPANQAAYDRWRQMWAELAADPDLDSQEFADRHGISVRQVQWIRSIGPCGLLDCPIPPAVRLVQMASANGHLPHQPIPRSKSPVGPAGPSPRGPAGPVHVAAHTT